MKEMLLWPKRTRIRNDGRRQWYEVRSDGAVVCEIDAVDLNSEVVYPPAENKIVNVEYYGRSDTISPDYTVESILNKTDITAVAMHEKMEIAFENYDRCVAGFGAVYHNANETGNKTAYSKYTISNLSEITGRFHAVIHVVLSGDTYNGYTFLTDGAIESMKQLSDEFTVVNWVKHRRITFEIFGYGASYFAVELNAKRTKKEYDEKSGSYVDGLNASVIFEKFEYAEMKVIDADIAALDINPIHKIREILTDDTAMNKPESDVNDVNFMKAADRIYDEGLGVSWVITEKSCMDAINELCAHIEAGVRINRQTGLYEMVLFRDDWFAEDEIHALPQSKIKSLQLEVQNADEAINQLNVSYYNREAIKDSSFSISENAAIKNLQGRVNAEEVKFPYFMNQRNAAVVAQWKLKQLSTPAWSGTFTTGFYAARKWNRYDIVKISWPQKNIVDLPVRIMSINLGSGSNNAVTIDFIEVVAYSRNLSSSVVIDTPIDTTPLPPQLALFKAFELSYFEAVQLNGQKAADDELAYSPDIGYAAAIAKKPQSNSLNALMYTSAGGEYEKSGVIQYCETAVLDQNISRMSTSFAVKNAGNIGSVRAGSQITVNDEIMVYQSFDAAAKILTVKRGALDTVPENHTSGAVLYFADDFVTVDPAEYAVSEVIDVKVLTATPSGVLSLEAPGQEVKIAGRAIRPYPPADVKINGVYFPETSIVTADLVLSWVHRNRVQQTGGEILGWHDGSVTAEAGLTYSVEFSSEGAVLHSASGINAGAYIVPASVLIPNKPHRLRIWAVRDGYDSYQKFEHNFFVEAVSLILTASVSKDSISGSTLPAANISVNVDESLKANMQFDGSGIRGKAPAGSVITVEIEE